MEVCHRAIPGTSALCAAAAAQIPGTVVHEAVEVGAATAGAARDEDSPLRLATPSGVVTCAADVRFGVPQTASASLFRTARPLMRGQVAVPH
jgi:2-methylaconitate cis-trans-isomerase PrpF